MNAELMSWKNEMENMLAAINRQTTHSLRVIRLIFKRCGRSLPPDFKQYFLQASSDNIKATYEQFELNSLLDEPKGINLTSAANTVRGSSNDGQSGLTSGASNDENDLDDEDVDIETEESESTLFLRPIAIDCDDGTNGSIDHQSNTDESCIADPEDDIVTNVVLDTDESDDSIEIVESQGDSTDADDNELIPVNVDASHLEEMTSVDLNRSKSKKMRLKSKNGKSKEITKTSGMKKSAPKQLSPKSQKRCAVCGYATLHMGVFKRHMQTHTGEKPHRCDQCGIGFTRAESLMKHTATHIDEFPFHCRVCFLGFSLKDEAAGHETRCKKRHYECHLCKKFVTSCKSQLITHMRIHTGDKPFRCEICMQRFGLKHHLKRHFNTVHA